MNDTHCAHFSPYLGWKKFSEKTLLLKFRCSPYCFCPVELPNLRNFIKSILIT